MAKTKVKTKDSAQRPNSTEKRNTAKMKRKQWMMKKFSKTKPLSKEKIQKVKAQKIVPPADAQHVSANWKILQEMLKANQQEKKQPVQPKHQNGLLQNKGAKESLSGSAVKNVKTDPRQADAGKQVKAKKAPSDVVPKDSQMNLKAPCVSEKKQSAALKRKRDKGKSNGEQEAKKKAMAGEKKPTEEDLWFDDVDPDDIEATVGAEAAEIMRKKQGFQKTKTDSTLVKEKAFDGITRAVAIDCEMVGVGPDGEDSILARVSLVNQFGKCIYDKYVKPTEKVTDYRTAVSGIRPQDIQNGEDLWTVQREVADILKDRIVVGHAIHNDLKILLLDHPKKKIRDTQKYKPFKTTVKSRRPALKLLCKEILNVNVQQGEHSSVQDAQATMRLYTLVKKQWEAELKDSKKNKDSEEKTKKRRPRPPLNKDKKLPGS